MNINILNLPLGQTCALSFGQFDQLQMIDESSRISRLYEDSYFHCRQLKEYQEPIQVTRLFKTHCQPRQGRYVQMGYHELGALALQPLEPKESKRPSKWRAHVTSVHDAISHNPDFEGRKFRVIYWEFERNNQVYLVKWQKLKIKMEDNN